MKNTVLRAGAALSLLLAAPALAQEGAPPSQPDTGGDRVTIGAGIATVPEFEGADNNDWVPGAVIVGQVSGIDFFSRGTQLYVDLVPDADGPGTNFELGVIGGVRLQRTGNLEDNQVEALGEIDTAYEVGGFVGVSRTGVITSDYDVLTARVAYVTDVGDAHGSYVITPQINYTTPLSVTTLVSLGASADYVGKGYARTYFAVTPIGTAVSGLPTYLLNDDGFKNFSLSLFGVQSLSGDLRRGFGIGAGVLYSKLLGDFKDSPIVRDSDQWSAAVGLTYTF